MLSSAHGISSCLPRIGYRCCACQAPLNLSEGACSALESPLNGTKRVDWCNQCWASAQEKYTQKYPVNWRKKGSKDVQKRVGIKRSLDEKMLDALRQSLEKNDEESMEQAYIACLYLMRRRILQQREDFIASDGQCMISLWCKVTEETFLVPKLDRAISSLDKEKLLNKLTTY